MGQLANPSDFSGNASNSHHGILETVSDFAHVVAQKWKERSERRAALRDLAAMSDYELHDIGACRGDIQNIVDGKFENH